MKNYVKTYTLTIILLCLCHIHITKTASDHSPSERSATVTPAQRYGLAALVAAGASTLAEHAALPEENRLNPYITMAGGPILAALLAQQLHNTSQSSYLPPLLSTYLIAAGTGALRVLGARHTSETLSQAELEKFTTDKDELLGTTFEAWRSWLTHLDSDQERIKFIQKEIDHYFSKEQGLNDIADFIKDHSRKLDMNPFTTRETLKLLLNNHINKQEAITAIRESDLYKKWSIFWPKIILYPENRHWNWEENKKYLLKKLRSLDNFLSAEQYNALTARVENTRPQDFNNLKLILYDMYHLNIPQVQRERNNLLEHLNNWLRNSIEKLATDIANDPHYRNNNIRLTFIKTQARAVALLNAHIDNIVSPNPSIEKIMPDQLEKAVNEILLPPSVATTPPLTPAA